LHIELQSNSLVDFYYTFNPKIYLVATTRYLNPNKNVLKNKCSEILYLKIFKFMMILCTVHILL